MFKYRSLLHSNLSIPFVWLINHQCYCQFGNTLACCSFCRPCPLCYSFWSARIIWWTIDYRLKCGSAGFLLGSEAKKLWWSKYIILINGLKIFRSATMGTWSTVREDWMNYGRPRFAAVDWFGSLPVPSHPSPLIYLTLLLSLPVFR